MPQSNQFSRVFAHRSAECFFVIMCLFLTCVLRVAVIVTGNYSEVQAKQSRLTVSAGAVRGTVFDCNRVPITNAESKIMAAVSPTPRAVTAISGVIEGEELKSVLERLKSGKPVVCEVPYSIECDGIACTTVYKHNSSDTPAIHLVGYTDSENHGVSGLEAAYDSLLYRNTGVNFVYTTDGRGNVLEGIAPTVENDTSAAATGVVSTIDINIQHIAEEAAESLETGAIVIADAKTNKIRASVSVPTFDCTDISEYLNSTDSPLLNRALAAYSVGSVFKPCVAAAGIETEKSDYIYTCTGKCQIADRVFKCHKKEGHGTVGLKEAIAFSCNTFFYNFSDEIGGNVIYKTASVLSFGQKQKICDGIYTSAGSIPSAESLENPAALANFSIGQGTLSVSPVGMLNLYSAIASNGTYYRPSLVEGTLEGGSFKKYDIGSPTRVMKSDTAELLRQCLTAVIDEGTGTAAKPDTVTAAGKTATAQTGKFENGAEICEAWFCGFFPAEDPIYTVIVFSQNSNRQPLSCGEIFAQIANRIYALG